MGSGKKYDLERRALQKTFDFQEPRYARIETKKPTRTPKLQSPVKQARTKKPPVPRLVFPIKKLTVQFYAAKRQIVFTFWFKANVPVLKTKLKIF